MKSIVYIIVISVCVIFNSLISQTVNINSETEEAKNPTFCFEADINSRYIYKGIVYSEKLVYQAGFTATYREFSAGVWGNINSPQFNRPNELTELDVYVSRGFNIGRLQLNNTAAVYFYYDEEESPTTAEYILYASYPAGPLTAFSDISVDIAEYAGAYLVTHGISYEQMLTPELYLNSDLSLSWASGKYNTAYIGFERSAVNYTWIDISLTYYHKSGLYIKPHFQYNLIPDKRLHEYTGKYNSFYGLLAGFTF